MNQPFRPLTDEVARRCGIGEGANCCAFLVAGSDGFECAQRTELADLLYRRAKGITPPQMHARRTPESDFPSCQDEGRT